VANGTCVITVKAGNVKKEITLTIESASAAATIKIFADADEIVYGQTLKVSYAAYQNGSVVETTFTPTISATTAAEIASTGDDYVILRAANSSNVVGQTFTLTVTSEELNASASKQFKIVGWF
jgi:hypothetical protein